jgi:hypothetical protein
MTAKSADTGVAMNGSPDTPPVSVTGPVSGRQDTGTTGHFARGLDGRFNILLGLALCALLSLLAWAWLRHKALTANTRQF